jgi:hypothetical protein
MNRTRVTNRKDIKMAVPGITAIACLAVVVVWLLFRYGRNHHPELLALIERFIDDESPIDAPGPEKDSAETPAATSRFGFR